MPHATLLSVAATAAAAAVAALAGDPLLHDATAPADAVLANIDVCAPSCSSIVRSRSLAAVLDAFVAVVPIDAVPTLVGSCSPVPCPALPAVGVSSHLGIMSSTDGH